MQPVEVCEICGTDVDATNVVRAEVSVGGIMCPSNMVMHQACYEQAESVLKPDAEAACLVDPDFPEMEQWSFPRPT